METAEDKKVQDQVLVWLSQAKGGSLTELALEALFELHGEREVLDGIMQNIIRGDFEVMKKGREFLYALSKQGRANVEALLPKAARDE